MHKLKAVFWDVDGTIADTELCGHRVAFNLAFKDFDLDWNWNESQYLDLLKISGGFNRIIHYRNKIIVTLLKANVPRFKPGSVFITRN